VRCPVKPRTLSSCPSELLSSPALIRSSLSLLLCEVFRYPPLLSSGLRMPPNFYGRALPSAFTPFSFLTLPAAPPAPFPRNLHLQRNDCANDRSPVPTPRSLSKPPSFFFIKHSDLQSLFPPRVLVMLKVFAAHPAVEEVASARPVSYLLAASCGAESISRSTSRHRTMGKAP